MVSASNVTVIYSTQFGDNIYAISADGSLAFGPTEVFAGAQRQPAHQFSILRQATSQVLSGDQSRLFRYQSNTSSLLIYDMTTVAPDERAMHDTDSCHGVVVNLPLTNVVWTFSHYALSYHVFFGTNQFDVATQHLLPHNTLGRVGSPSELLPQPLSAGATYYWRVDGIGLTVTNTGVVWSFTTSLLTVAQQAYMSLGIAGMPVLPQSLSLTSPLPIPWSLAIAQPWLSASATSGVSPSTVTQLQRDQPG